MHEINSPLNFARSALFVLDRRASRLPQSAGRDIESVVAAVDRLEDLRSVASLMESLRAAPRRADRLKVRA